MQTTASAWRWIPPVVVLLAFGVVSWLTGSSIGPRRLAVVALVLFWPTLASDKRCVPHPRGR